MRSTEVKAKPYKFPLNYTGGKTKLLPQILPLFPQTIDKFVDLFCGGGNVAINVSAKEYIYNDKNQDLIDILRYFRAESCENIVSKIENNIVKFSLSDSMANGYAHYGCNSAKGLGAYNKCGYLKMREKYNQSRQEGNDEIVDLVTLIIFAFNNQIRFNGKDEFNLPVGKRDFNRQIRHNLKQFVAQLQKQENDFLCIDFRDYDLNRLTTKDFVYCDPPYLITTATYNERSGWSEDDEKALLNYLADLDKRGVKFALSNVLEHKGRHNTILEEWSRNYIVNDLNFCYNNSNYQSRNTTSPTREVLITNY